MTTTESLAIRQARKDAENYLNDCESEDRQPDNNVSYFGGWDGWAIEGVGQVQFAREITGRDKAELEDLWESDELISQEWFVEASKEYHKEFSRIVQEAIDSEED